MPLRGFESGILMRHCPGQVAPFERLRPLTLDGLPNELVDDVRRVERGLESPYNDEARRVLQRSRR